MGQKTKQNRLERKTKGVNIPGFTTEQVAEMMESDAFKEAWSERVEKIMNTSPSELLKGN